MYFFKADISSFDDEAETVFIIPEQNADENGVPFEEKMITQTVEYKAFVKRTKTALVDCTYTQYQTDEPIADGLNSEKFAQLETEGKLAVIDANTYSISTGKSAKSKGKKNFTTYLIIGGIAVATVILIAVSALSGGDKNDTPAETTETSAAAETAETDTPTEETTTAETEISPAESSEQGEADEPVSETTDTAPPAETAESEDGLHRSASRLELTEEERADPELQPYIHKAGAKADKLDAARAALPKKRVPVKEKIYDAASGKAKSTLRFEQQDKGPPSLKPNPASRPLSEALLFAHGKIHEVEHENVGVEGGHKGEELVEHQTAKVIRSGIRHHKMKPYKAVEKAERELRSANAEYFYQKSLRDNPQIAQAASNPISRMWQKRRIKQQYAKAARQAGQAAAQGAAATAENGFRVTKLAAEGGERVAEFAARNWKTILIVAVFGLLALLLITGLQSCTVMAGTAGTGVTASSYFSKDKDMLGAEKAYAKLEQKLQRYLDTYEATHNYDEYHFYLDEIEHDPYVLISILSALHDGVFTLAEVQGELEMLFEKQYILTETVTMQIRYRTKMMVIIGPYGVPQVITYQEPYEYYICTVKLKNKDLSHLPVEVLTEEQLSAYSLYMRTLGNRPDLFGKAQYPNASTIKQPTYYDIPPEALKDDRFAAMMEEATKYIGYPYVWGGSSPSTSFDCSGYISWVLNHSGWNVGRQTAQGLYNLCTPVSTAQVKPGDLVFFKGTYDTPGVSHCGIYVGNSIMLHCGDPISYTNLNSKYWQEHFYSYGRLP